MVELVEQIFAAKNKALILLINGNCVLHSMNTTLHRWQINIAKNIQKEIEKRTCICARAVYTFVMWTGNV